MNKSGNAFAPLHIVAYALLSCGLLVAGLFIFYLGQKPSVAPLSTSNSVMFPIGRDIRPFKLTGPHGVSITQHHFAQHWTLLFFGFTHCNQVCPTTLAMLARAYTELQKTFPELQVVFVSLDPERDTPENVDTYVKSFHPQFMGATGPINELHQLQRQFNVFSAREETPGGQYQIQHTPSIMLIDPKGKWVGLFGTGAPPEQFVNMFVRGIRYLSS